MSALNAAIILVHGDYANNAIERRYIERQGEQAPSGIRGTGREIKVWEGGGRGLPWTKVGETDTTTYGNDADDDNEFH